MKLAIDSLQRELDAAKIRVKHDEEAIKQCQFHLDCHKSGHAGGLEYIAELELAITALGKSRHIDTTAVELEAYVSGLNRDELWQLDKLLMPELEAAKAAKK